MRHQLTGNSGLFYLAWQLSRRGWHVIPTMRNARGADLYVANTDETRVMTIQSKALSKLDGVPLGGSLEKLRSEWWIITVKANDAEPTCYVLTRDEVLAAAEVNTKNGIVSCWLSKKAYALDTYRDAFHRLDA